MKLFTNTCEFDYPWERVTAANWNKYPNEASTHVIAVDVLRRELQDNGNVLVTERLITIQQGVPRWLMVLVGCKDNRSYVREISTIDLKKRSLMMRSCNLSYVNFLRVFESVDYIPDPMAPKTKTVFRQEAQITAYGTFSRICDSMEDFSIRRFYDNAQKGKAGFEKILKMFNDTTDEISNTFVNKYNETVDDIKQYNMLQDIERKCTILSDYYDIFNDVFARSWK